MPRKRTEKAKKLRGTDRKGQAKTQLPLQLVSPAPESGLDDVGRAEWKRVVDGMSKHGLISNLDASILAVYCQNFSRWKRCEAEVMRDGETILITTFDTHGKPRSKKPIKNPALSIAESASRLMSAAADRLGLSPSSRSKFGIENDPADAEQAEGESLYDFLNEQGNG